MSIVQLNANSLYNMLLNGYRNLKLMENRVNDLNVFPVPDGDTGTNMIKTLGGGFSPDIENCDDVASMMSKFSKSVLLAARGNSGVILSQYIRGWANSVQGKKEIFVPDILEMMKQGTECAYGAVPTPVEGTILTVLRESCECSSTTDDLKDFFKTVIQKMKISVSNTPELLPVLKDAGVVDSGGMGMLYIMEGMWAYLNGEIIEADSQRESSISLPVNYSFGPDSVLEYGYCTEFVLQLMNAKTNIPTFSIKDVISYLQTVGDSIVAVQDENVVKVHVHTFKPEKVLAFARNYGEFISVKIENMSVQHNEINENKTKSAEKIKYAIVTVAMGEGIKNYFAEIGANRIIDGGQTQNPSARDFIDTFDSLNAEHIVVLPNNSNIYATALQAADMYDACDVRVLKTTSVAEGYSALSMMNTWAEDIDAFISDMTMALNYVTSGSITKAVHDANLNGISIKEGMYMAIADGDILCTSQDKNDAVVKMLHNLSNIDEKSVITVFYGDTVTEDEAKCLVEMITNEFPLIECGIVDGKQPIYDYYMAIE